MQKSQRTHAPSSDPDLRHVVVILQSVAVQSVIVFQSDWVVWNTEGEERREKVRDER